MDRKQFFESLRNPSTLDQVAVNEVDETLQKQGEINGNIGLQRRTNTGISAYKGSFGKSELMHLLR